MSAAKRQGGSWAPVYAKTLHISVPQQAFFFLWTCSNFQNLALQIKNYRRYRRKVASETISERV